MTVFGSETVLSFLFPTGTPLLSVPGTSVRGIELVESPNTLKIGKQKKKLQIDK
jgi:hypothetical protein